MDTLNLFIGVLVGLIIFIVGLTSFKVFRLFRDKPEDDYNSHPDQIEDQTNSFIDASQDIAIDVADLDAGNELSAMKYKLEMFMLRNRFYKNDLE